MLGHLGAPLGQIEHLLRLGTVRRSVGQDRPAAATGARSVTLYPVGMVAAL
jgi:hypothetical protein